jgi:hypothetical protein
MKKLISFQSCITAPLVLVTKSDTTKIDVIKKDTTLNKKQ